jgi:late competence protein required for DNA uptake (superfamily II DNA/RNA helicase)
MSKNWIVRYYDEDNEIISSHPINNREEHAAEHEAEADIPEGTVDWSLTQVANPDNDEFECDNCNCVFDIDESVRIEKGVLFCEDCAEQQRRDEKNGLYPEHEDIAN